MRMQVSVVMPLFNKQDYVLQAINSVLIQKEVEIELLIIDDGSTDKSMEIVNSIDDARIRVYKQQNLGPSTARNRGMREARFPLIAFLDGDDYWAPKKLFKQASYLEAHPEISAVYSQALRVDVCGNLIYRKPFGYGIKDEDFQLKNLVNKPVSPALGSTLMIRKDILKEMAGFDEAIVNGEDTDLELRLAQAGHRQHLLPETLAFIRIDSSSLSHSFDEDRWAVSYRSHLLIYEKLRNSHPLDVSDEKALNKILNVHLRQFLYYQLIGKHEAANDLRNTIVKKRQFLEKDSRDFYAQIEFFTPLIFQEAGWPALELFINKVFAERDQIMPNTNNATRDELTKIKAIVWCAGQAQGKLKLQAWRYLFGACGKDFRLFFNKEFWKQVIRLLIGNLIIWINVRFHFFYDILK